MHGAKTTTLTEKTATLTEKTTTLTEKTATILDFWQLPAIRDNMMAENKALLIEFHGGPADGKRESIDAACVNRPILYPLPPCQMSMDCFDDAPMRVATYQSDGSYTKDGVVIVRIRSFN